MSSWLNEVPYRHADATQASKLAAIPGVPDTSQFYVHTVVPPAGATTGGGVTAEVLGPSFFANAARSAFPTGMFSSGGGSSLNYHAALSQLPAIIPVPDPLALHPITGYHSKEPELHQIWVAERRPLSLLLEPAPDHLLGLPADSGRNFPVEVDQPGPLDYGEKFYSEGGGVSGWDIELELAHRLQVLDHVRRQIQSQQDINSHSTYTYTHFNPEVPTYRPAAPPPPNTGAQVTQQDSLPAPEERRKSSTQVLLPDSSSVGLELLFRREGTVAAITDEPKVHPSQVEFHKHPVVQSKAGLLKQNIVTEPQEPKMSYPQVNIPLTAPGGRGILPPQGGPSIPRGRGVLPPQAGSSIPGGRVLPPQGGSSIPGGLDGSHRRPMPPEVVQEVQEFRWSTLFDPSLQVLEKPIPNIDAILSRNTRVHEVAAGAPPTNKAAFCGSSWRDVKLPTVSPESFPGLSDSPRTSEGKRTHHGYIDGKSLQNFEPGPEGPAMDLVEQQAAIPRAQGSPTASEKKLSIIERRLANQRAGTRRSTRSRRISRRY